MTFIVYYFIITACIVVSEKVYDSQNYNNTMWACIQLIDSSNTTQQLDALSKSFEVIAAKEEDEWLPYYYAGYVNIKKSIIEKDRIYKELFLNRADEFIHIADSIESNNSEIISLIALSLKERIALEPEVRWKKYSSLFNSLIDKAITIDPQNPRPELIKGQMLAIINGEEAAKPYISASLNKFNVIEEEEDIEPHWGRNYLHVH